MTNTSYPVETNDTHAIARFLAGRPEMISAIKNAGPRWPDIAKACLQKRLSAITDVLSNETLEAIANGMLDFPALCASVGAASQARR